MVVTLVPNAAVAGGIEYPSHGEAVHFSLRVLVFSGLRVYALSGANIKLSAIVVALAIAPRILDSVSDGNVQGNVALPTLMILAL